MVACVRCLVFGRRKLFAPDGISELDTMAASQMAAEAHASVPPHLYDSPFPEHSWHSPVSPSWLLRG